MINSYMRLLNYYTIGNLDKYGQAQISYKPTGQIKISISLLNQSLQESILYSGASYIGFTTANVDDTYIIEFQNKKLKVLYVNPFGRFKQVFLTEVN